MALYDGFFDAVLDEETGQYDREYDSAGFTEYFGEIIGSGVCVYQNPGSFKVRVENGAAVIAPGYLFIQGYWLRNDADYTLELPESGIYAILAHLNLGQRTIEILSQEKADPEVYPDSLVLAYITMGYGGLSAVEDTRSNTNLCGMIDAIGGLVQKVDYAIHYIDTEIDGKLAEAESNIAAQSKRLDEKITEVAALVEAIAPPPVGTIKFSVSQNIGAEWLPCDGSFINQEDYPELVEALGKVTPGVEDFKEVSGGTIGSGLTNGCLYDGTLWLFSATDKRLYGYTAATRQIKSLSVTGTEKLTDSPANPICLSITSGHLFLAQNQTSSNSFVLLECSNFTGSGSAAMTELDVNPAILAFGNSLGSIPGEHFIPEVVTIQYNWGTASAPDIQPTFIVCMGRRNFTLTGSSYIWRIFALLWKQSDFPSAKMIVAYSSDYRGSSSDNLAPYVNTLFRYSSKNANELLILDVSPGTSTISMEFVSVPNGVYNSISAQGTMFAVISDPIRTSPVAGNGRYIYRCFISEKKLNLRAGKYNPNEPYAPNAPAIAPMPLPSRANVFPDSVCYAANQDLWFVFVGTGIAFSPTPEIGASWGYLDTQDVLGVITQFGSLDYDPERNLLYISGQDSTNKGRLGVMQLPELYDYANDGAWLPMIASDGVPAYIKAKGTGGEDIDSTLRVTVLEPVYVQPSALPSVAIIFNGVILGVGTSNQPVSMEKGTFTAGLRILSSLTGTWRASLYVNGSPMATIGLKEAVGTESTVTRDIADYLESGVTLQWKLA